MSPRLRTLSIVIPAYNEERTIHLILDKVRDVVLMDGIGKEIVIVNDGSKDGTADAVRRYMEANPGMGIRFHEQPRNMGKGAAIHRGILEATGEYLIVQDADLEYDPRDYPALLKPIQEGLADVVYGSRFLGAARRVTMFWHQVANQLLTFMTNILYDSILTDMETGYKVFRREVIEGLTIRSRRFNFEPEFTAKILKRKYRIFEVPITFNPRDYADGKKIKLKDAFEAVFALLRYRFFD